jgi:hypothetical protein
VAVVESEWDPARKRYVERLLDKDRKPLAGKDGVATTTVLQDDRDQIVRVECHDAAGRPVAGGYGAPVVVSEHDARGNVSRLRYLGPDGRAWKQAKGAVFVKVVDDRGLVTEERHLDESGNPVATRAPGSEGPPWTTLKKVYDDRGLEAEYLWLDAAGRPARGSTGIARIVIRTDARGNTLSRSFLGPDDAPCPSPEGVARVTWGYTADGFQKEMAYYDPQGKLKLVPRVGYARRVQELDPWGFVSKIEYRGAADEPIAGPEGYARVELKPDEFHRVESATFFDPSGRELRARLVITAVDPAGRGAALGLQKGDVITHYAGKPTPHVPIFQALRENELPNEPPREMRVERDGKPLPPVLAPPGRLGISMGTRIVPPDE